MQINRIAKASWGEGDVLILFFTGAPTVKHNQAASATHVEIMLAGSADFVAAADSRLVLCYHSTKFYEIARTVA